MTRRKGFSVKFDGRKLNKFLDDLARQAKDLTPAMKLAAAYMHTSKKKTFDKNGMQPHWPALSPMTVRMREKKGKLRGHGQLRVTGRLYQSVQGYPSKEGLVWGSDDPRAKLLQEGGNAPAPKNWTTRESVYVPGRKFVRIYYWDHQKMTDIVKNFLKAGQAKAVG